jgi:hypothetical protein
MRATLDKPTKCTLCSDPAVAIYYLPRGCIAYPELFLQALCWHHERRAQPRGSIYLVKDLWPENELVEGLWPERRSTLNAG